MQAPFADYLERLQVLHAQIEQALEGLSSEALDWSPGPEINSLAVLVTHATGAERYWIGDVVGRKPSGRDREAEFRVHGLDAAALRSRLAQTLEHTRGVLESLSVQDLEATRSSGRGERQVSVAWALAHVLEHTGIHVGHIQIIRQLWDQRRPG